MKTEKEILFINTKLDGNSLVENLKLGDVYGEYATPIDDALENENEEIYLVAIGFEDENSESEILISKPNKSNFSEHFGNQWNSFFQEDWIRANF